MAKEEIKTESTSSKAMPITAELRAVLVAPRLSEKSVKLAESHKYVFRVAGTSNKVQVKKAVEKSYKVNVVQVNIVNLKGKHRSFGKTPGKTSGIKKAIVTLKEGQKIEGALESV